MLAAVIERPGAVTVREVPVPRAAGLALVRVCVAGICGTDRKLATGVFPVTPPRVLGHEMTGWVEVPGPMGAVPAGARVVVNPAAFCGLCRECRRDLPHLCARGGLAERRLDVTPLVTGRFPLPETAAALAASEDPAQLKVVLDVAGP